MVKKLSVAFIWHMHQPGYKDPNTNEYIVPWVRLHAIKDYLDMLLFLERFPKIHQTFNITPLLIDQLNDYGYNNAHDIFSRLTVTPTSELSDDDKVTILNHFFDANYENMIMAHEPYQKLQQKRFANQNITINDFSDQEYADIMAWFNLVWFDPSWKEILPDLKNLYDKEHGYTFEDRKLIIEIQREIIRNIIPKYKEFEKKGQIEVSTSPYYHPLIPVLLDAESTKIASPDIELPDSHIQFIDDAKIQTQKALKKFKDIFGNKQYGMWPPEQCISPQSLTLMAKENVKWTIADEGILSKTIQKDFVRNFNGDLEYPYHLCKLYNVKINDNELLILFRNSVLSDLISFEYHKHDAKFAANDFYERIKNIQDKLQNTPDEEHVVTIALDAENCWENYKNDGKDFLESLYSLLSEDDSLEVTTVSNFIEKATNPTLLSTIYSGSWINKDFRLWIGEPTKNIAWEYLYKTREDLITFTYNKKYTPEDIDRAWEQIYMAEASDWFWWYGEPNDSGQDDLFDKLFRIHLQNVYKILEEEIPDYLLTPLETYVGKLSKSPDSVITIDITGKIEYENKWKNAGCMEVVQGPVYLSERILKRLMFGNDKKNIYLRFDIYNEEALKDLNEIFVYFISPEEYAAASPMRIRNKGNLIPQLQKYSYSYELEVQINNGIIRQPILSKAIDYGLWKTQKSSINYAYDDIIELSIPFSNLDIKTGQEVNFVITTSRYEILQEVIPNNKLLFLKRPI